LQSKSVRDGMLNCFALLSLLTACLFNQSSAFAVLLWLFLTVRTLIHARISFAQFESWSMRGSVLAGKLCLVDLLHQVFHQFVDILIFLGARFPVMHVIGSCDLLRLFDCDFTFVNHVNFVSYQDFSDSVFSVFVDALKPHLHRLERGLIGHIEGYNDALSLLIE